MEICLWFFLFFFSWFGLCFMGCMLSVCVSVWGKRVRYFFVSVCVCGSGCSCLFVFGFFCSFSESFLLQPHLHLHAINRIVFYLEQKDNTFLIFTLTSAVQALMPAPTAVTHRVLTIISDFTHVFTLIESNPKALFYFSKCDACSFQNLK